MTPTILDNIIFCHCYFYRLKNPKESDSVNRVEYFKDNKKNNNLNHNNPKTLRKPCAKKKSYNFYVVTL